MTVNIEDLPEGMSLPDFITSDLARSVPLFHPGGNPGANVKSISHRCHPILMAVVWELTEETIDLPLG